jgi:hypothetical protein
MSTKNNSTVRTQRILRALHLVSWLVFLGLLIETGSILISYIVSCVNPESARDLYKSLDLYNLRKYNFLHYSLSISFMIAVSCMNALVWFLLIKTVSKVTLKNPFTTEVAQKLSTISYVLLVMWFISVLNNVHTGWLSNLSGEIQGTWISGRPLIFMAGIVYIISQLFKRGVEIQTENELTI